MTSTPTASSASEPRRRLRLQHRIVVAVILVALVTSGVAAWVAVRVTADAFRSRLQSQLANSVSAVSSAGLALNPVILRTLSGIVGARIVTLDATGAVLATSHGPDERLVGAVRQVVAERRAGTAAVVATDCGFPCLVAVGDVAGRPGVVVALAAGLSELETATRSVARTILMSAVLSVVMLVLFTQVAVRRLIVPLDQLVRFVRGLAPGESSRRAPVGNDEVGELSDAFNTMLDRLERSQAAALRSEKLALAGLFAARVAHDVRNPLSSIKLQAQMLRAHAGDADVEATLAGMLRDIEQVELVVSDLMELARPGDLRRELLPVNDVVADALQHMKAQFSYRKIGVEARLADGLPPLRLDRTRFKQALLNLLANASEALPTGGQVRVSTARANGDVCIEVCDDGAGVPEEILDRVFEPFVSSKREGVGLGLVNVKAVVESHGGRVTLQPRQPRGTCARIELPADRHG